MRKLLVCLVGFVFALGTFAANWNDVAGLTPTEKARPAGVSNGIYYGADGTSVTLCTYAASKTASAKRVFLLGDMTDWKLKAEYQLYKDGKSQKPLQKKINQLIIKLIKYLSNFLAKFKIKKK